jgi:hypothetical protein
MRPLLTVLFVFLAATAIAKPNHDAVWQQANNFYQQKQYDSAVVYYEQLVAQRVDEAELYYNLGNAYYRLNQTGPAVLNYERSLQLDPSNKQTKENLLLAQSQIINRIQLSDDIFFVGWWKLLTHAYWAQVWAVAGLILFVVLISLLVGKRLGKISVKKPGVFLIGAIWTISMTFAIVSAMRKADSGHAVVMQHDAPFATQPNDNRNQSLIPEGTTVSIKGEQQGWFEVSLPDGRKGWMRQAALAKI